MAVHLLIYLIPVMSVNIQALRRIFKSQWHFKTPKMTIHVSPFGGLPLLLECPMSRHCSVSQIHFMVAFFLLLLIPATLFVFLLLSCCTLYPLGFAYAIPSLESSYPLHWTAAVVLQVSALKLFQPPCTFSTSRLAHTPCYQPCGHSTITTITCSWNYSLVYLPCNTASSTRPGVVLSPSNLCYLSLCTLFKNYLLHKNPMIKVFCFFLLSLEKAITWLLFVWMYLVVTFE